MYKFQQPEDQVKFILPLNRDTECLYYNTRMIIDANVLTNPRAWLISKINRNAVNGVVVYTAAQDLFNQHTDVAFYRDNGDVDYWVADWKQSAVTPENIIQEDDSLLVSVTAKITTSGNSNQLKVGGSKTFTVTFYEDDQAVDYTYGSWAFYFDDEDASDLFTLSYPAPSKVKAKFTGGDTYIGKVFTVKHVSGDVSASFNVEIIAF